MALVTVNELKDYMQYSKDGNDGIIERLLARSESELKLSLDGTTFDATSDYEEFTEYYDGDGSQTLFVTKFPIRSVTSVNVDSARTWGASTLISSSDIITNEFKNGWVRLYASTFQSGRENVKIVYKAGWKTTDAPSEFKQIIINRTIALLLEGVGGVNVVEEGDFIYRPEKLREQADKMFTYWKRY